MDSLQSKLLEAHLYTPLAHHDNIRLLYLQPGHPGDEIKCTIRNVKSQDNVSYKALSYVWGEITMKDIVLNERPFEVRENLWHALVALRDAQLPIVLWVDAACINQEDDKEKSVQVSRMGNIYSYAAFLVWLGPLDSESRRVLERVQKSIAFIRDQDPDGGGQCLNGIAHKAKPSHEQFLDIFGAGGDGLMDMFNFCYLPYWGRLWIIQEIMSAKKITLHSGDQAIEWDAFSRVFTELLENVDGRGLRLGESLDHHGLLPSIMQSTPARFCKDIAARQEVEARLEQRPAPLLSLCADYGEALCFDMRDKIFGLHSLGSSCCRDATPVDYLRSLSHVYQSLMHHHVHRHADPQAAVDSVRIFEELHMNLSHRSLHFHERLLLDTKPSKELACSNKLDPLSSSCECRIPVTGTIASEIWYVSPVLNDKLVGADLDHECEEVLRRQFASPGLSYKLPSLKHPLRKMFMEAGEAAERSRPKLGIKHISLAIDLYGRFHLVSSGIVPGDVLCDFARSSVVAIGRSEEGCIATSIVASEHEPDTAVIESTCSGVLKAVGKALSFPGYGADDDVSDDDDKPGDIIDAGVYSQELARLQRLKGTFKVNTSELQMLTADPSMRDFS